MKIMNEKEFSNYLNNYLSNVGEIKKLFLGFPIVKKIYISKENQVVIIFYKEFEGSQAKFAVDYQKIEPARINYFNVGENYKNDEIWQAFDLEDMQHMVPNGKNWNWEEMIKFALAIVYTVNKDFSNFIKKEWEIIKKNKTKKFIENFKKISTSHINKNNKDWS